MAHEPKLDVFKISIHPKADNPDTFKAFLESNYQVDGIPINIDEAYTEFYKDLLSTFANNYHLNNKRKKGLGLEAREDRQFNDSIRLVSESKIIYGVLKGGRYGQNRSIGNINLPNEAHAPIGSNNIVFDNFYFLLYTPFESSKGILMIQSYTDDTVNDIFQGWLAGMMRNQNYFYPTFSAFCPERIQEEFKNNSVVKEMTFSHDIVLDNLEERDSINADSFTIEVHIKAKDDVRLNKLPDLKRIFKAFGLKKPENRGVIRLEDFNRKVGRLVNGTRQSSFELEGNVDIKPTIFLRERIALQEDESPDWDSLNNFSMEILQEIIPEIYPELQLINQENHNESAED